MRQKREDLVQYILKLSEDIYKKLTPGFPEEWLSSDLTVAQLRVLLTLRTEGPVKMSGIASNAGTALSTATGIVDNLIKKSLVIRDTDPNDRRVVICKLSPEGKKIMDKLWEMGQLQIKKLLDGLNLKQLGDAAKVAEFLLTNI